MPSEDKNEGQQAYTAARIYKWQIFFAASIEGERG